MGMFDRMLKNAVSKGINEAVGKAVEQGVKNVVQPAAERAAAKVANVASERINKASEEITESMAEAEEAAKTIDQDQLSKAFSFLEGMATNAAMDLKECPACGEVVKGAVDFCPSCGAKLPEMTLGQGALCPACGKQNTPGTKFCVACGEKLPAVVEEEKAIAAGDEKALALWAEKHPEYPVWNLGGNSYELEEGEDYFRFRLCMESEEAAQKAVDGYRALLKENGFKTAGEYPTENHLYKMVDGTCYHVDTEHCFDGDLDKPEIGFDIQEPSGGFYYVKAQPSKKFGLKDLLDL